MVSSSSSVSDLASIYVEPHSVTLLEECQFYHSINLPEFGLVEGQWDLRGRTDEYLAHVDFTGKRVLDVGTASGFLTFEIEQRGASEIVSFDAAVDSQFQPLPFKSWISLPESQPPQYNPTPQKEMSFLERMHNSYWLTHRLLQSNAKAFYGDVYNLPDSLGQFDVAVIAQILVHLRDPIGAISSVVDRIAPGGTLIIAEGMVYDSNPYAQFLERAYLAKRTAIWWHLSTGLYQEILAMMGFRIVRWNHALYRCVVLNQDITITTLVAERTTELVNVASHAHPSFSSQPTAQSNPAKQFNTVNGSAPLVDLSLPDVPPESVAAILPQQPVKAPASPALMMELQAIEPQTKVALTTALVNRVWHYYARWTAAVAASAILFNVLSLVAGPLQGVCILLGTTTLLFLIGHAASKSDRLLQEMTDLRQGQERLRQQVKKVK